MNFPSFGLTPAAALKMFKKALEAATKKPVTKYKLIYRVDANTLSFLIEGVSIPYNNDKVMYLIKTLCKTHLKDDMTLDILILDYDESAANYLNIYYTKDNKKETIKHLLK